MCSNLPEINSWWMNRGNKNIYKVMHVANVDNLNPAYPVSVVYGCHNDSVWVKPLDNFLEKMVLVDVMACSSHNPRVLWGQTKEEYMLDRPEWVSPDSLEQDVPRVQ